MAREGHFADCAGTPFRKCRCEPRRYLYAGFITAGVFLVEFAGGQLFGSTALWADSAHVAFDEIGIALSYYVALRASDHPDQEGLRRRFMKVSAALLLIALGWVAYEALGRFAHPEPVVGAAVMFAAAVGIVGNLAQRQLIGEGEENETRQVQLLHIAGDLFAGIAIVVSGAIVVATGWVIADPICSCVVVVFVGGRTIRLLARRK